jgi:hypothetical protein
MTLSAAFTVESASNPAEHIDHCDDLMPLSIIKMNYLISICGVALLLGCQPPQTPPQPIDATDAQSPPVRQGDAAPRTPQDATFPGTPCGRACTTLNWLGCPEGFPTPKGETCDKVCQDVSDFGISWPTACMEFSRTIDEMRHCGNGASAVKCGLTK